MEFTSVYSIEKIPDPVLSQGVISDSSNPLQIETMNYHERQCMRRRQKRENTSYQGGVFKRISSNMIKLKFFQARP